YNIAMVKLRRIQKENYKKEIALVLPALTRWGTHLDCIKFLMKSQTAIQQMLFDPSVATLNLDLKTRLQSNTFWVELNTIIKILKPIISTLKVFESNNSTISTVYSRFNTILLEIQKIEYPHYFEESKKDKSICLTTFADFIALKYSADEASKIYAELLKFRNKQTSYNNLIIWNSATLVNSATWWTSWPSTELQKFAI
ncbi:9247_t:CDS:2, partial [Racocetra persica]